LVGFFMFRWFVTPVRQFLPGLLFPARPTATVTHAMAAVTEGSPNLPTAPVSMNTLASCLAFILWLSLF
jgi:hypothetical protein